MYGGSGDCRFSLNLPSKIPHGHGTAGCDQDCDQDIFHQIRLAGRVALSQEFGLGDSLMEGFEALPLLGCRRVQLDLLLVQGGADQLVCAQERLFVALQLAARSEDDQQPHVVGIVFERRLRGGLRPGNVAGGQQFLDFVDVHSLSLLQPVNG